MDIWNGYITWTKGSVTLGDAKTIKSVYGVITLDEIDEYFGQMAPPKSDSKNASSSKDKIRPKSDNDLPDICFRWFWESSCKRKDCPYPHPEKITQAEIVGWKSFYKKLSQHRVKSAIDLLLPRLPEEQKKLHSIEANDAEVPMPKTDYSSSNDST
jgi:hypothetical protein